jgi:hypothetical protein
MMHFCSTKYFHLKSILLALFAISSHYNCLAQNEISNYKVFFAVGNYGNEKNIIIRKFEKLGKPLYIAVNPNSMEVQIIPPNQITATPSSWSQILQEYKNTPYIQAILKAQKQSFSLEDSGISHGFPKEKGITLTIDLCPSHKPLDRIIFTTLISEFKKIEIPVPIALSITGRFMLTHSEDLVWIEGLIKSGEITVTWINHTYNHHFNPKTSLATNFLLEPNTDLSFEILGTEIALLQRRLLFSTFFRFPGLVSNHELITKVTQYGLIPIGSDAWLAKGQAVHSGSIVLIHGNGNEPIGVSDFIHLLQTEKNAVMKKEWLLYDLRESVESEFKE